MTIAVVAITVVYVYASKAQGPRPWVVIRWSNFMAIINVHLLPRLVDEADLAGSLCVVIDVLRATTTMAHALAAGCAR